jgi:hypothetical protein
VLAHAYNKPIRIEIKIAAQPFGLDIPHEISAQSQAEDVA